MEKENLRIDNSIEHLRDAMRDSLTRGTLKPGHEPGEMSHSVREVNYKRRKIRIETSYRITVDGEPVLGHVMVGKNGQVHYHSIPNQEYSSAVDMVKSVIDLLPSSYTGSNPEEV